MTGTPCVSGQAAVSRRLMDSQASIVEDGARRSTKMKKQADPLRRSTHRLQSIHRLQLANPCAHDQGAASLRLTASLESIAANLAKLEWLECLCVCALGAESQHGMASQTNIAAKIVRVWVSFDAPADVDDAI